MTYLGKREEMGVTSASEKPFSSPLPRLFKPEHILLHLCLTSLRCWDLGQPSPAVKPSKTPSPHRPPPIRRNRIHLSRHLSHPVPLTNPVCAHRRVSLGRGWSPEYGPNAEDHVLLNLSFSTVSMSYSNTCIWMSGPAVQIGDTAQGEGMD